MFENLNVTRVTLHHVFKRPPSGDRLPPVVGAEVFRPSGEVAQVLRQRLVTVLGSNTKSMAVDISKSAAGSTFQVCRLIADSDDEVLLIASARVANNLADAQTTQVPSEGFLFVICGSVGPQSQRFVALMKAEPQNGFSVQESGGISFSLLNNLVLTPASKLYKVGIFIEKDADRSNEDDSGGWIAHLYDDNMTQANRQNASIYFYEAFLGCALPKDSAFRTKQLYDLTERFISTLEVEPEIQNDYKTALYSYLKLDKSTTISVDGFADTYFADDPVRMTKYKKFMQESDFPAAAFTKDIKDLSGVLKRRTIKFPSGTRISGLASAFDKIDFRTEERTDSAGASAEVTIITVPEKISSV